MKKRILSLLLVVAMMLPMVIMPASAIEPASEWTFADEFEELDARNVGQYQIDVGAAETTGVVVDGKVDANDNYTVTQVFNYGYLNTGEVTAQTTTHPDITVKMARKGTALYIAFIVPETEADSTVAKFQLGMGVSQGPTISHAVKRANMFLNANGTYAWNSLTYYGGTAGNDTANNPAIATSYIDEYKKAWVADDDCFEGGYSTYEVNIDLNKLAFIMTTTKTDDPYTVVKMLQIMFFYYPDGKAANCYFFTLGKAWNNENNPYKGTYTAQEFIDALKAAQTPVHTYGATTTVIGHPIAFGGAEVQLKDWTKQDELGAVGTDVRNLDEGHVIDIQTEAAVAPVIDGVISNGEYTVTNKLLEKAKKGYGDSEVKANFAYKDGYLYVAVTTPDTQICKSQLDMSVLPYSDFADTMINRCVNAYSVAGVNGGCNAAPSIENGSNAWAKAADLEPRLNYGSGKYKFIVDYAAKLNDEGKAVYEYKISLATLAEFWKNIYPVSEGYTYFGIQFWFPGVDGSFDNGDQYSFRSTNSTANLKAIDCAAWGLEWVVYTISIPETIDSYKADHMVRHFYNDVDFETAPKASIRITSSNVNFGLRFKSTFDAAFIESVKAAAGNNKITYGTIIAPTDYVANVAKFTMEALDEKYGEGNGYVKVIANIDNPFAVDANGNVTIAGSITNIKEANLERDFSAVGFVQYGDTVVYSAVSATRSIADIAIAAVNDYKTSSEEGYTNMIAPGVYSPYTKEEYELLMDMTGGAEAGYGNDHNDPFGQDIYA